MKAQVILAKTNSGGLFDVEFSVDGECVRVFCHCPAGKAQMMCKHRLALINGNTKMLFEPAQASKLAEIRAWPQFARLQARIARYERELEQVETEKAEIAEWEKTIKVQVGKDLKCGGYDA